MNLPPSVPGIDLNREKACLFTRKGELLWTSPAWWPDCKPGPEDRRMLGFYFHELVHREDYRAMLKAFADPKPGIVSFRCMLANTGEYARFTHYKMAYGPHWLTLGKSEVVPVVLPTMPCDFYLDEDTGTEGHKG